MPIKFQRRPSFEEGHTKYGYRKISDANVDKAWKLNTTAYSQRLGKRRLSKKTIPEVASIGIIRTWTVGDHTVEQIRWVLRQEVKRRLNEQETMKVMKTMKKKKIKKGMKTMKTMKVMKAETTKATKLVRKENKPSIVVRIDDSPPKRSIKQDPASPRRFRWTKRGVDEDN